MVALDAGISAIGLPNGMSNYTTINPMVYLKNFGANTLTNCTINYKVDNGAAQTYSWTGSLATNAVTTINLPSMNVAVGTHTFSCYTTFPNSSSDGNVTNDMSQVTFGVVAAGIQDLNGDPGFGIYPNPVTSYVNIEGSSSGKVEYSICNMLGDVIRNGNVSSNGSSFSDRIDVSTLPKGMYFLRVIDGDSSFTKKLNKQ